VRRPLPLVVAVVSLTLSAQEVPLEYRVKAAYLFNFTRFVEWPAGAIAEGAPLTMCVAAPNPFGESLSEMVAGEQALGHPLAVRTVHDASGCHVLFVPERVNPEPLLREARTHPVLTVGESADFLRQGGLIGFVMEDGKVRFEINQEAAQRSQLRISSRLLRLARPPERSAK
jgi:hypothetical protein